MSRKGLNPKMFHRYERDGAFPFSCFLFSSCDREEPCQDCISGPGILVFLSYYRQLSADIKMKNYKIKTSFVRPGRPKAQTLIKWVLIKLEEGGGGLAPREVMYWSVLRYGIFTLTYTFQKFLLC